ncbi:MAG: hypothetical protein QW699_02845 [Metallosphaera sp.]
MNQLYECYSFRVILSIKHLIQKTFASFGDEAKTGSYQTLVIFGIVN